MPTMLKTVLGKSKKNDSKAPAEYASDSSDGSSSASSDSDSSGAGSESGTDDDDKDEEEAGDRVLPTYAEAIDAIKWMEGEKITCLVCPDKKIVLHQKKEPWESHIATNAHLRRLKRFKAAVESKKPEDLPLDPRDFVRALDAKIVAQQEAKAAAPPKYRKIDSRKAAITEEKRRLRKIHKADKKARREHRKRAKAGLPVDPAIDQRALQSKLALGWTPSDDKTKKSKKRKAEDEAEAQDVREALGVPQEPAGDEFGMGADHISLDVGDDKASKPKKSKSKKAKGEEIKPLREGKTKKRKTSKSQPLAEEEHAAF